jgi:hypothetical protein
VGEGPSALAAGLAFSPEGSAKGLRAWWDGTGETARPETGSCRWRRCGGRSRTMEQMNRYGQMALDHWRKWRPQMLAGIPDPESYFSTLGLEVEQAIDELADRLAGPGSPDEPYLHRVGRLRAARMTAESDMLREMVLLPPEWETDQEPEPDNPWLPMVQHPDDPEWQRDREYWGDSEQP